MGWIRYGKKRQRKVDDRPTGHIGGGGLGCYKLRNSNIGGNDDGRGMGRSFYQEFVFAISTSGFGTAVMTEWVLR